MRQHSAAVLAGLGTGAALMFYLDPDRGRRRRAMTRDRVASTASAAAGAIQTARIDAGNRAQGVAARWRHRDEPRRPTFLASFGR